MVIKRQLKEKKGVVITDAIVAILIILLFTGIITTLITNIILESTKIKMNSQHVDFITEILEYVEQLSYENVTEKNLIDYINNKGEENVSADTTLDTLTTAYRIAIKVENYNETEGNTDKLDIIKIITVTLETDINGKEYSTTISSLKKATIDEVREILEQEWWKFYVIYI